MPGDMVSTPNAAIPMPPCKRAAAALMPVRPVLAAEVPPVMIGTQQDGIALLYGKSSLAMKLMSKYFEYRVTELEV